jgi:hypothetical protein
MDTNEVFKIIEEVREQMQRDMDQSVLQRNRWEAFGALCGRDACDRITRALSARAGIGPVVLRSARRPR